MFDVFMPSKGKKVTCVTFCAFYAFCPFCAFYAHKEHLREESHLLACLTFCANKKHLKGKKVAFYAFCAHK